MLFPRTTLGIDDSIPKFMKRRAEHSGEGTHGCRKFWNIHARKTDTDLSGKPLCGLHS